MEMHLYDVFIFNEKGGSFTATIPAFSEEDARRYVDGNGEIVGIRETTMEISEDDVTSALKEYGLSQQVVDIISRALSMVGITQ